MNDKEARAELTEALKAVGELLSGWPTMRALSAHGAFVATDRKAQARKLIDAVLAKTA